MPSFVCNKCQETLKKPKLDIHVQRCRGASFSCIDCNKVFKDNEYQSHFTCISEVEKYEKKRPNTDTQKPNVKAQEPGTGKKQKSPAQSAKPPSSKKSKVKPRPSEEVQLASLISFLKGSTGPLPLENLKKAVKKNKVQHLASKDLKRLVIKRIQVSAQEEDLVLSLRP